LQNLGREMRREGDGVCASEKFEPVVSAQAAIQSRKLADSI
jgi:hypothetical protein